MGCSGTIPVASAFDNVMIWLELQERGRSSVNIFLRLQAEHRMQRRLANSLYDASVSVEVRRNLLDELCGEVEAHAAAEEQTLYAELLGHPDARIREQVEEHDQACESLRHLRDLDMESPQWMATFAAVAAALERHLEAEETRLLPLCQALLSEERAAMLGLRYDEYKRREIDAWGYPVHEQETFPGVSSPAPPAPVCARGDNGGRPLSLTRRAAGSGRPRVHAERTR
ncbi:MAG TPA: hemerythrin domain-containing protein [Kiloniellaceae bacterium]